jgi:hypothetical protein
MKKRVLKKKIGRPSAKKTPLALLRSMLTVSYDGKRVPLAAKTVADWLNIKPDTLYKIESGRRRDYPLTPQNAEIIFYNTGADLRWLLGKKVSPYPITPGGERLTQRDFERAQGNFKNTGLTPMKAQHYLPELVARVANILLHAAKRDEVDLYALRLRRAIIAVLKQFPKPQSEEFPKLETDLRQWIDTHQTVIELHHDYENMLCKWDAELLKLRDKKYANRERAKMIAQPRSI